MAFSPLLQQLIEGLRCLPSVGPKSAQRMAFHLLEHNRLGALSLAEILQDAMANINHCQQCRTLAEEPLCVICTDSERNADLLCVLESPVDLYAVEQTGGYHGYYFVLGGHLSPIDGIGPEDIGIDQLLEQLRQGQFKEVIIATNPTVEGEATAFYIAEQIKDLGLTVSRIAHGVPVGGELEYVDGGTLAHALAGRRSIL